MADFVEDISPRQFLDTLGLFTTGVTIITTESETGPHGMTANAVTSLSLNPMLVIFCVAKKAHMADYLKKGAHFTINILRDEQEALSNHFAGQWREKSSPPFRFVEWPGGPRIEGVLAAIGCEVHDTPDGGDHVIVLGKVVALHHGIAPHNPLIYFKSRYRNLSADEGKEAPARLDMQHPGPQMFWDPWEG